MLSFLDNFCGMKTSIEKEQVNYQTETQMSGKHCSVRKILIFKLSTASGE